MDDMELRIKLLRHLGDMAGQTADLGEQIAALMQAVISGAKKIETSVGLIQESIRAAFELIPKE